MRHEHADLTAPPEHSLGERVALDILARLGAGEHTAGEVGVFPLRMTPDPGRPGKWTKAPTGEGIPFNHTAPATTFAEVRASWPADHTWADGIGVCPLGTSRLVILDVDGERGRRSLGELERLYGTLPDTPAPVTSSGDGYHLWYMGPAPLGGQPTLRAGIETRAGGATGFLAYNAACSGLPPALGDIAELPDAIWAELAQPVERAADPTAWVVDPDQPDNVAAVRESVRRLCGRQRGNADHDGPDGDGRNNHAFRFASWAGDLGVRAETVLAILDDPADNGRPADTITPPAAVLYPGADFPHAELADAVRNGYINRRRPLGCASRAAADVAAREPAPERVTATGQPADVRETVKSEIAAWFATGGRCLLSTTPGVGKTAEAIRLALEFLARHKPVRIDPASRPRDANGNLMKVVYALPEHSMTRELMDLIVTLAATLGLDYEIWYGQDRLCDNPSLLSAVRDDLGEDGASACDLCPLKQSCAYPAQRRRDPDLWIVAHAQLTNAPPFTNSRADVYHAEEYPDGTTGWRHERVSTVSRLVVDESPLGAFMAGVDHVVPVSLDDLDAERTAAGDAAQQALTATKHGRELAEVLRALGDGPLRRHDLPAWCEPFRLRELASAEWTIVPKPPRKSELVAAGEVGEVPDTIKGSPRGRLVKLARRRARFWHLLADWVAGGEEVSPYLELVSREAGGTSSRAVAMRWMDAIDHRWRETGAVLALDATADPAITRAWLGEDAEHVNLPAAPLGKGAELHLIPSHTGKGRLTADQRAAPAEGGDDGADGHESAAQRAVRLRTNLSAMIETTGAAVIGNRHLTGGDDDRGKRGLLRHEPVESAAEGWGWFNALRGRNFLNDVMRLMVVGRPLPGADDCARYASVIFGRWVDPTVRYQREPVPIYARDGQVLSTMDGWRHPDELAERVRRQICEAEIEQAIDRARPARRSAGEPLVIDLIVSDVVPALPVDVLHGPDDLEIVPDKMAEGRGLLPDAAVFLHAALSDYWPSVKGLRRFYERHGMARRTAEDAPSGWRMVRVKAPSISRKSSKVAVRPDVADGDVPLLLGVQHAEVKPTNRS